MRNVCLSIAVGNSLPGKYLSGAINGAKRMHQWAEALGYQSIVITDEDGDVTIPDLRRAIDGALWPGRDQTDNDVSNAPETQRLILYFAGHGLLREAGEALWLLSDWKRELRAVGVEPLKRRLYRYPLKQVTIIGDACLDLPANMDQAELEADAVLGSGPGERVEPLIDRFTATQEGTTTFMVPGADPEDDRCVFSGVLLEGLWGLQPGAFSKYRPTQVTSASLSSYLRAEVPKVSARYEAARTPSAVHSFPEGQDIYFASDSGAVPPVFPPWPDPGAVMGMGLGRPSPKGAPVPRDVWRGVTRRLPPTFSAETEFLSNMVESFGPRSRSRKPSAPQTPRVSLSTLMDQLEAKRPRTRLDLVLGVHGSEVAAIWHGTDMALEREGIWWAVQAAGGERPDAATPLLVESVDGQIAAALLYPQMITRVIFDRKGAGSLTMGDGSMSKTLEPARKAILAMEKGGLKPDQVFEMATDLRRFKHVDPMLGAISAYLYDAWGDVESIRRMAYFYVVNQQPIPFDIALLGLLRGWHEDGVLRVRIPAVAERKPLSKAETKFDWTYCATPSIEGVVGGNWPWMRQGWAFLEDLADEEATLVVPELLEALPHLGKGRFATVDRKGAGILSRRFGLERHRQ